MSVIQKLHRAGDIRAAEIKPLEEQRRVQRHGQRIGEQLAEGFVGYLEKPIRYKQFLASVAALLEGRNP